ncbi:hypothetical protein KKF97_06485 [Myxococcota bacterium]|nr:hypothetical protein [Myxococcota bacterium]
MLIFLIGCDDSTSDKSDAGDDAGNNVNSCDIKAENCATEDQFGSLFTKTNGRADGTLIAIVRPQDQDCALPNSSHVTLQLSISGGIQRLVVSAVDISYTSVHHSLLGPAFEKGWHEDQDIDYWNDLGVHSTDFTTGTILDVIDFICENLEIGQEISVFAYSDGSKPSSAHQIHRNDDYPDGAIVVNPTSDDPIYLLFRYSNQVF